MKYSIYKTETGLIHTQGSSTHLKDLSDILLEDGESIIEGHYDRATQKIVDGEVVTYTPDFWQDIRNKRNTLLRESDWTQMSDSPLSDAKKTEWATYRKSLRDLPTSNSSASSYDDVTFPSEPS